MLYSSVNNKKTRSLDISDRGLAYGDGIFTTAKIVNGKVQYFEEHIQRLQDSCERLKLVNIDFDLLVEEVTQATAQFELAVLKVVITAGSGGRGYSRQGTELPSTIVTIHPFPEFYSDWQSSGVTLGNADTKLGINPLLSGIKHLNRLEQVLVRHELDASDWQELVVCDINDNIIEATSANIFWLHEKQWYTPIIDSAGVSGLKRNQIIEALPNVKQVKVSLDALDKAEELFICNSVMGIVPISNYNGKQLTFNNIKAIQQVLSVR